MKRISRIPIDKEATNSSTARTADDDSNWAVRSGMWRDRLEKASARRTKRAKAYPALILAGHGVSLRIRGGALEIQNGLTHFPQSREGHLLFRRDADLPERIILLDGSGSISFDVLSWLAEHLSRQDCSAGSADPLQRDQHLPFPLDGRLLRVGGVTFFLDFPESGSGSAQGGRIPAPVRAEGSQAAVDLLRSSGPRSRFWSAGASAQSPECPERREVP